MAGGLQVWVRPLSPIEVLSKIQQPRYGSPTPRTPGCNDDFGMSLLRSSPPDSTELRQANDLLRSELRKKTALLSPARRYNERALTLGEVALSDNIILRKRLADAETLLSWFQEFSTYLPKPSATLKANVLSGGYARRTLPGMLSGYAGCSPGS